MHRKFSILYACGALMLAATAAFAEETEPQEYPIDFALTENSAGELTFVKFPEGLALYVFDGDSAGKSNCNLGCASAWPPVFAGDDAEPIGQWTIIVRDDGSKQWAYKDKPVYMFFHDVPGDPQGAGEEGWALLQR